VIGVLGTLVAIAIALFSVNGDTANSRTLDVRRIAATGTCHRRPNTDPLSPVEN
jgi:hypothetical protein